ncbi:aminoacyl-histidine dipeptidase [Odoribacter sp. OttesenSCG-928-J03]|nr:aminoacyl-histidine dipeptidase [Odoribacter sp. OttesenSCG-928-J03]MDL2283026.1 aminoacyl-histidine dipeptidase [Odoribacter sp. OttesenSCG-928-G04]MDL2331066.1 aminoacyl-histidine dipeptidase [Odoribacter sp. OttesenSCG-928-A06]
MVLKGLKPEMVWSYFEEICQVPRPSKKEEKIAAYLMEFAKKHQLEAKLDEAGNVLIKKPAVSGMEKAPIVVLQSHMDMVCEKNEDTVHDFDKDPIQPYIDGEWVKAKGTTLGADDGIGMAAQMALLVADNIKHGPLECLFTVDEETGLTGAFALKPGFFDGRILLNLDSEDEGEIFIGCAGGVDTLIDLPVERIATPDGMFAVKISVKGLQGGHSGDDINKGRGNAIKILNRFLWEMNAKYGVAVAEMDGGNLRNAIAREAYAVITFPNAQKENLRVDFNVYMAEMENVWKITEPGLKMDLDSVDIPKEVLSADSTSRLLNSLYACPHGVFSMSYRMPGMVETSTNLASVKMDGANNIKITTSQRSDIDSEKYNIAHMVAAVFELAGAKVVHGDGYPGWAPNPNSKILKVAAESYKKLFGKEPIVRSIHAGLECGLFLEKYPDMDMISFGPTLRGVHSPDEKINIRTVEMWWEHLLDILGGLK